MWFWLIYLLTIVAAPIALLFGRPVRVSTVRATIVDFMDGRAKGTSVIREFKLSSLSPYVEIHLWPWTRWALPRGIVAMSLLGYAISREDMEERTRFHEAIHTIQQASHPFFGPLGAAITYAFDTMQFKGWADLTATPRNRGPLAERIAYYLDGRGR